MRTRLKRDVDIAYDQAVTDIDTGSADGTLLRGEVLARWQEFVGTGELLRALESKVSWLRDRITNAVKGKPQQAERVTVAVESGLQTLLLEHAEAAAERADASWRSVAAGAQVLEAAGVDLSRASRDFRARAERMVRDWQTGVLDLVRTEGGDKRTTARFLAYGVNGLSVALMVVVFASTGGVTGAEVGIAGGSAVVGQKVLEAVFGDQAVRRLALNARKDLTTAGRRAAGPGAPALPRPARRPRAPGGLRRAAARRWPARSTTCASRRGRRRERAGGRGDASSSDEARPLDARLAGLEQAVAGARGRLDDAVVDQAAVGRRPGRCPAAALGRAHRGGAGRRHRVRQVVHVQRAGRPRSGRRRRTPPDDVVRHRLRLGRGPGRRAARVARDPAAPPGRPRLDARPRPPAQGPRRAGAARPARPRLHRGQPPPRGGAAGRPDRPDGVGARPAEVRRPGGPPALPRAARHPPRRDARRAQPHRRGRRRRAASRCSPTCAGCSRPTVSATYPCSPPRPAPARASTSCAASIGKRVADKAATRTRLAGDIADAAARLAAQNGDAQPRELAGKDRRELVDALADSAGVPIVVDAVQRATTLRARRATGWPLTAWVSRLRPDPLRRLHLDRGTSGRDVIAAARSSMPAADYVQKARVETTVRVHVRRRVEGPGPAVGRARSGAPRPRGSTDLEDRLDRAVTTTELGVSGTPAWCRARARAPVGAASSRPSPGRVVARRAGRRWPTCRCRRPRPPTTAASRCRRCCWCWAWSPAWRWRCSPGC